MSKYLPDLTEYPDSESKRRAENLSHQLEILITEMGSSDLSLDELRRMNSQANQVWWELNAQVGNVLGANRIEKKRDRYLWISFSLSMLAVVVSLVSILVGIYFQ